ncbi:unnamed protein product [Closterium sp. NIES-64]|nr:unnamed protein product [Closterium sp. NIES-65]CAI5984663.1 unnamed protein product [Closterium sp. NIES-64]
MAASLTATVLSAAFAASPCLTGSVRQGDAVCVTGSMKPLRATGRRDLRVWSSGEGGNAPAERILSLEDILSAAEKESSDLVFSPDDADDDNDDTIDSLADDPFVSRSPVPTDPNAPAAQLFPSADDMEKVLSAYNSAPAAIGEIGVDDLKTALEGEADAVPVLIDVRAPEDYKRGHIPGAVSVPMGDVVAYAADAGSGPLAFVCYAGAPLLLPHLVGSFCLHNCLSRAGSLIQTCARFHMQETRVNGQLCKWLVHSACHQSPY